MRRMLGFLFVIWVSVLPFSYVAAQSSMSPSALVSTGASTFTASGEALSYSVGQWAYRQFGDESTVEEGVQQVFCVPIFDTIDTVFCLGNIQGLHDFLPQGYTLPEQVNLSMPGRYEFVLRHISRGGCDSIVWVMLSLYEGSVDTVYAQGVGCYSWHSHNYEASGFYADTLVSSHGCDSIVWLHLSLLDTNMQLPQIYSYNDKVLMVDNSGTDYYYYRWYCGDSIIAQGVDADSYHNGDGTMLKGCYHVEVAADSSLSFWVSSNELCFGTEGINLATSEDVMFTLIPNPVQKEAVFRVTVTSLAETQLRGARIVIYDIQGRRVVERAAMSQTSIQAAFPSGVYSVHLLLPNGRHAARKLVVR